MELRSSENVLSLAVRTHIYKSLEFQKKVQNPIVCEF